MHHCEEALFIVKKLKEKGYVAYYAGGWVRDFLLQEPSEDIDIATNAPPETIQTLFEKTLPIGIAFGILLVFVGEKKFEVATFRSDLEYKDGRRPSKIVFTTAEKDASRRDFTINGMFYDPLEEKVIDFVGGKEDLEKKIIRAIGDPEKRFQEDRLRMIRAVRLASRFRFTIEKKTQEAIYVHAKELFPSVAIERVWQEFVKMSLHPGFRIGLIFMHHLGLLSTIFPQIAPLSKEAIEKTLAPLENFPKKTPTISYLLELFLDNSLEEKLQICDFLKLSQKEKSWVIYQTKAERLFQKRDVSNYEWAHLYAHPSFEIALFIFAARLSPLEKDSFVQAQNKKQKALQKAIQRIQEKTPLFSSSFLQKKGIKQGKTFGLLLEEGEKIVINEKIEDPEKVFSLLKEKPFWEKEITQNKEP